MVSASNKPKSGTYTFNSETINHSKENIGLYLSEKKQPSYIERGRKKNGRE